MHNEERCVLETHLQTVITKDTKVYYNLSVIAPTITLIELRHKVHTIYYRDNEKIDIYFILLIFPIFNY